MLRNSISLYVPYMFPYIKEQYVPLYVILANWIIQSGQGTAHLDNIKLKFFVVSQSFKGIITWTNNF